MRPIETLIRQNVKDLKPFSSARAEYEGSADIFLDANENPFDTGYNRYPDPYQKDLKKVIAQWRGVQANQVLLGNGSDEIIDLLVRTFCEPKQDRIRFIHPSFGMYEVVADINDVAKMPIPLLSQFELNVEQCLADQKSIDKILFLCTPNNPTGNSFDPNELKDIVESFDGIVVIDEAYIDFSTTPSMVPFVKKYDNLVILQTFSKALGAAGLRLGMAFTSEKIISYINKIKPPYNIGTETQKNALTILKSIDERYDELSMIIHERERLYRELGSLPIVLHMFPSDANFILIKFDNPKAILKYLMDEQIIVRDRSNLPGCAGCLRITVGLSSENDQLISALKKI